MSVNVEFGAVVPVQPLRRTDPDESLLFGIDTADDRRHSVLGTNQFKVVMVTYTYCWKCAYDKKSQ